MSLDQTELREPPSSLPPLEDWQDMASEADTEPPEIIPGILCKEDKLLLTAPSKAGKTWLLLDLALCVCTGQSWLGFPPCNPGRVLYLNLELRRHALKKRVPAILRARGINTKDLAGKLKVWNLRACNFGNFAALAKDMEARLAGCQFALVIIDPMYKILGDTDENSNNQVTKLLNEVEAFAAKLGAAAAFAHHFAKGNASGKNSIDRMSGAGAWARDPDAIMTFTPHAESEAHFTVTTTLRNFQRPEEFVVRWKFPQMQRDEKRDPKKLKRPNTGKGEKCSLKEFLAVAVSDAPQKRAQIIKTACEKLPIRGRTASSLLAKAKKQGLVVMDGKLYCRKPANADDDAPPSTGHPVREVESHDAKRMAGDDTPTGEL